MKISSRLIALKYKCAYNSLLYINRNNPKTRQYQEEGLKLLEGRVERLPDKIAFRPKFITQSSCVKIFDKLYLFISKANLKKPAEEKYDALFHEIGHWLHFSQMPPVSECIEIWKGADIAKIEKEVSTRAIAKNDGREFIAEGFKGLAKGKKFDDYIMNLYRSLKGPKIKPAGNAYSSPKGVSL